MPTYDKPQFHTSEGYFVSIYNNIKLSTKKQTNKRRKNFPTAEDQETVTDNGLDPAT